MQQSRRINDEEEGLRPKYEPQIEGDELDMFQQLMNFLPLVAWIEYNGMRYHPTFQFDFGVIEGFIGLILTPQSGSSKGMPLVMNRERTLKMFKIQNGLLYYSRRDVRTGSVITWAEVTVKKWVLDGEDDEESKKV